MMQYRNGRARSLRSSVLVVEHLEDRWLPSALGSVLEKGSAPALGQSIQYASGPALVVVVIVKDGGPQLTGVSSSETGSSQKQTHTTDHGDNSDDEDDDAKPPSARPPSVAPLPVQLIREQAAAAILARSQHQSNSETPPVKDANAKPPGAEPMVASSLVASVPQPSAAQGETRIVGPAASTRWLMALPEAIEGGLDEQVATEREVGTVAQPECHAQKPIIPRLAGEVGEIVAIDVAMMERGLRHFLDQLGTFGRSTEREPGTCPESWLEEVSDAMPWLGLTTATAAILELTRRRWWRESGFAISEEHGRWDWILSLPDARSDVDP